MTFETRIQSNSTKEWFCCLRLYKHGQAAMAIEKRKQHTLSDFCSQAPFSFRQTPDPYFLQEQVKFPLNRGDEQTRKKRQRIKRRRAVRKEKLKSMRWREKIENRKKGKKKGSRFQNRFLKEDTNTCLRVIEPLKGQFCLIYPRGHALSTLHFKFFAANSLHNVEIFNHWKGALRLKKNPSYINGLKVIEILLLHK